MLKTLGAQIKEFKKDSLLTPIFMVLEVFMEMLIPLLMASIIDDGVNAGNLKHIYITGGLMFVMACFSLCFGLLGAKYGASASTGFARNLRKAMYERTGIKMKATSVDDKQADIYTKLNTAEAIKDLANNQNNSGTQIMGMNLGNTFSGMINKDNENK